MYKFKLLFLVIMSYGSILLAGDLPCNATFLDVDATGGYTFDNSGNFDSGVFLPPYASYGGQDSWFSFIMPSGGELPLVIEGLTMDNPAIAVYSGDCWDPKLLYIIKDNNCFESMNPAVLFDELVAGETYFIRVWAELGSANGSFTISFDNTVNNMNTFLVYADAFLINNGECIQLTTAVGHQNGCAWYEEKIDFSQAFTHTMSAYFGVKDLNGADGICLVYQTNGSDYCGISGAGIGALGMPNSLIIEFDTYQNLFLNDPIYDHSTININGDLDQNNSIDGPVNLGNIEDGNFHDIEFSWDPSNDSYIVVFDGVTLMSGNYDFINASFGGETEVWWGYTSATGGLNNNHVICPDIDFPISIGTQEYLEVVVCDGGSYQGYTASGFYIDFVSGADNCLHQINIDLTIVEPIMPYEYVQFICEGDEFYFEGDLISTPGLYNHNLESVNGCDSLIIVDLRLLDIEISVIEPEILNCIITTTNLDVIIVQNNENVDVLFEWVGPNGILENDELEVSEPGIYYVNIILNADEINCIYLDSVIVEIDSMMPNELNPEDIFIMCGSVFDSMNVSIQEIQQNVVYNWYHNNEFLGTSTEIEIFDIGLYVIQSINELSGCITLDSFSVILEGDIPSLTLLNDTINCIDSSVELYVDVSDDVVEIVWYYEGDSISNSASIITTNAGMYNVSVKNESGCTNTEQAFVYLDNQVPIVELNNDTIPCNTDSIQYYSNSNNDYIYSWNGPNGFESEDYNFIITEGGTYYATITNLENGCQSIDSINILDKGLSPIGIFSVEKLDCNNTGYFIDVEIDDSNVFFEWEFNNEFFSNEMTPFIDQAGDYKLIITSVFGCEETYYFVVELDMESPVGDVDIPNILDCESTSTSLETNFEEGFDYYWTGPNGYISFDESPIVSTPGIYELVVTNQINGCISMRWIEVFQNGDIPDFVLTSDNFDCLNDMVTIELITNDMFTSIEWVGVDGFSANGVTAVEVFEPGSYTVTVINEFGCEKKLEIEIDDITLSPEIELISEDTIYYEIGETYAIDVDILVDEENISSIVWEPAHSLSCSDCLDPEFTTDIEENINYTLTVINEQGCVDELYLITRLIIKEEDVVISAPNIMVANESLDPANARFAIYGSPEELIAEIQVLRIFDRWGNRMFEQSNFEINNLALGWNGRFKDRDVIPGVYVYAAEVLLTSGTVITLIGDVTVIR